jgi:hypothetical protein
VALIRKELGTVGLVESTPGIHSVERSGLSEATWGAFSFFSLWTGLGPQMGITLKGKALFQKENVLNFVGRLI